MTYSGVANHELDDGSDESHVEIRDGIHRDAKHVATRASDENGGNGASVAKGVLQSKYHSKRGSNRTIHRELILRVESSAPTRLPLHGNGVVRVQPDFLTDDDGDSAETPRRLDSLALLYLFLVFLLGAALQSSVNFVNYSHSNPLPPLDHVALQGCKRASSSRSKYSSLSYPGASPPRPIGRRRSVDLRGDAFDGSRGLPAN